jgi:hypothetical protein
VDVDAVLAPAVGLSCRSCGNAIEASRVDLVRRLAACTRCNRVLALRDGGVAAGRVIPETFEDPEVTSDGTYRERALVARTTWRHRRPSVEGALSILGGLLALAMCAGLGLLSHPVEVAWVLAAALATIGLLRRGWISRRVTRAVVHATASSRSSPAR